MLHSPNNFTYTQQRNNNPLNSMPLIHSQNHQNINNYYIYDNKYQNDTKNMNNNSSHLSNQSNYKFQ